MLVAGDASVLHHWNPIKSKELCSGALRDKGFSGVLHTGRCAHKVCQGEVQENKPGSFWSIHQRFYSSQSQLLDALFAPVSGYGSVAGQEFHHFPLLRELPSGETLWRKAGTGFSQTATRLEEEEICGVQGWAQNSRKSVTYSTAEIRKC